MFFSPRDFMIATGCPEKAHRSKKHEDGYSIIALWNGERQNDFIKALFFYFFNYSNLYIEK